MRKLIVLIAIYFALTVFYSFSINAEGVSSRSGTEGEKDIKIQFCYSNPDHKVEVMTDTINIFTDTPNIFWGTEKDLINYWFKRDSFFIYIGHIIDD